MKAQDVKLLPVGKKLFDDKVKGLFVQANADGTKTFRAVYRNKFKRQRKVRLGLFGQLTIDDARSAAQEIFAQVARGLDPAQELKCAKEELTVDQLMLKEIKEHWSSERFADSQTPRNVCYAVKKNFAPIAALKLSELTTNVVNRWHKGMKHIPIQANRCLAYLSTAINLAVQQGITSIPNPCEAIERFPGRKRNRYATPEEIQNIAAFLENNFAKQPEESLYLYMILTTGTRPSAINRLRWDNLDIRLNEAKEKVAIISFFGKTTYKTGEAETIIIPPKTLEMILRLKRTSPYIINCTMPRRLWRHIQKKFDCPDLWVRDLRRTYATVALSGGVPLTKVGELLNHKSWDTTKIYAKLMPDQRIASAMQVAKSLDSIMNR